MLVLYDKLAYGFGYLIVVWLVLNVNYAISISCVVFLGLRLIIQPNLLKADARSVHTRVFVCGPGFASGKIAVRDLAKNALESASNVVAVYGEEIEAEWSYRKLGTDLQTLEAQYAHDVDFTLLILDSPGSIAELGTFTQMPALRDRLVVLLSNMHYMAESYIARGPLSLLSSANPNSVIYFDQNNTRDVISRVLYPLTFYKYAHYIKGYDYVWNTRISLQKKIPEYAAYIAPIRRQYEEAITLISILVVDQGSYGDILYLSGLAPRQLNGALHRLYLGKRIEKIGTGRYQAINGFHDDLLHPFSSTELSKLRAKTLATA
ncbi:retron St85 family effector protein [Agrobacterium leguminum]